MSRISGGVSRCVRWSPGDSLLLMERRDEFEARENIWYSKSDFIEFREEALHELREFMKRNGIQRVDEALSRLYQPQDPDH